MVCRGREEGILAEVDNYREIENYAPEGEKKANNDIAESQLDGLQYELTQGNEEYSSERTKEIIEQAMPGMRKETPRE